MRGISRWATVSQLREDLAEVMDFIAHHQGRIAVSRYMQAVAVVLSVQDYLRLTALADEASRAFPPGRAQLTPCRCSRRAAADSEEW